MKEILDEHFRSLLDSNEVSSCLFITCPHSHTVRKSPLWSNDALLPSSSDWHPAGCLRRRRIRFNSISFLIPILVWADVWGDSRLSSEVDLCLSWVPFGDFLEIPCWGQRPTPVPLTWHCLHSCWLSTTSPLPSGLPCVCYWIGITWLQ